jgi:hypothetical protein
MSNYYGSSFIYNNIPSETYDLRILDFQAGGVSDSPAGSDATLHEKFLIRRPNPYLFAVSRNAPLEIAVTVGTLGYTGGFDRSKIEKWLLSAKSFLPLQIVQEDMSSSIFYVIFKKSEIKYIGNLMVGLTLHGEVNAPWSYEAPKTLTKTYSGSALVYETFNLYNYSDDEDYLYPSSLIFTTSAIGNSFSLTNLTESSQSQTLASPFEYTGSITYSGGRAFSFTGISANETITTDCYRQTISSSTGLTRIDKFNKQFFRLLNGNNQILISGGITNLSMTYQFAKKIGG